MNQSVMNVKKNGKMAIMFILKIQMRRWVGVLASKHYTNIHQPIIINNMTTSLMKLAKQKKKFEFIGIRQINLGNIEFFFDKQIFF